MNSTRIRNIGSIGLLIALTALAALAEVDPDGHPRIATIDVSPDGATLAFGWGIDGDFDIYHVGLDGSGLKRLTDNDSSDYFPDFSPDGKKLVFNSNRLGSWDVFELDLASGEQRSLTDFGGSEWVPRYSPDGSRITYYGAHAANWNLIIMDADGSNAANLTHRLQSADVFAGRPVYEIPFYNSPRMPDGSVNDLYVIKSDGRGIRRMTDDGHDHWHPHFSPNGEWIIYSRDEITEDDEPRVTHMFLARADGSASRRITAESGRFVFSSWLPDSSGFVFTGSGPEGYGIFRADVGDGSARMIFSAAALEQSLQGQRD